jgi:predicted hydrocarbon binding protein
MIIKSSNLASSRRQFLKNVLPTGTLFCFGCSNLFAFPISEDNQKASTEKHKFLEDSGFTYEDVFEFAYRDWLIPIMQSLANEIGKDELIEMLKRTSSEIGAKSGRDMAKSMQKNDLTAYASNLKANELNKHVLTYEIVEETDKAVQLKITECLWAKTFHEAKASDIGYAVQCHRDYAWTSAFNPKMRFVRTKTLMQGHDCCNNRRILEG